MFMLTSSALLALCAGNSPVTGEFPAQRPVTRSFDAFFDLRLNKRLSKQSWGWWFETPSQSLWRHCNVWFCCLGNCYKQTRDHDIYQQQECWRLFVVKTLWHYVDNAFHHACRGIYATSNHTYCPLDRLAYWPGCTENRYPLYPISVMLSSVSHLHMRGNAPHHSFG